MRIRIKSLLVFLTVAILVAAVATGCGSASKDDKVTIGMIVKFTNVPYNQAFIEAAKEKAKELGAELVIKDSQGDALKAMEIMDTYLTMKVDGILYGGSYDETLIIPGIKRVNQAGLPIVALDASPEGGKVDLFISSDIQASSKKATEAFVEGIKQRNNGQVPQGVVILVMGSATQMFGQECNKGFFSVMSQYPQVTVDSGEGKWNNKDAHDVVSDKLTRHGKNVLGVYIHTPDIMGQGAVSAIEAAGLKPADYGLAGYCMGPEGLHLIKEGKFYAIANQTAYDAASQATKYLYNLIKGEPVPKAGDTLEEKDALWSPAKVIKNPYADEGDWIVHQAPVVPRDISADDPRLWENKLSHLWK